jgi:hypothetical protein
MPPSQTLPNPSIQPGHALDDADVRGDPWILHGVVAGVIGASAIAVFFLIVDWMAGRPLWTPHTLGSIAFRGELPDAGAPVEMLMVLGYTAIHGAVFIAFGYLAAFEGLIGNPPPRRSPAAALLVTALIFFVAFELSFLGFALALAPVSPLIDQLDSGRVALANGIAALGMAGYLSWARSRHESG